MLAFTDGLTEALSPDDAVFGEDRLIAALAADPGNPQSVVDRIGVALAQHMGSRPAHDDVTILCLSATIDTATDPELAMPTCSPGDFEAQGR